MKRTNDLVILAVIALGALVLLGQGSPSPPSPSPGPKNDPPKPPDAYPDTSSWIPYDPTPIKAAQRATELLLVMQLGDRRLEADPSGRFPEIEYRCTVHPADAKIPHEHKGVDVWRPKTTP